MTVTLDAATEKQIQREIDLGHYREPSEVIARAVDLLAEQQSTETAPVGTDLQAADRRAVQAAFGLWKDREEDGLAYQLRMRDEW